MPAVDDNDTFIGPLEPTAYAWHDPHWATLTRDPSRLPHALLLHGQAGVGKGALALRLARFLLCSQVGSGQDACGACQNCLLFRAGSHPDLLRIAPQEDSQFIVVDQIRGVIDFLSLKPHMAVRKIVIIAPAEGMNVNAANGLLKILEEPPLGSLLLLVATHLSRVAMTLRSRCVRVAVGAPPAIQALAWLRSKNLMPDRAQSLLTQAGGAPLAALEMEEKGLADCQAQLVTDLGALAQKRIDPVSCAERWKTAGPGPCLDGLYRFLVDTVRAQPDSVSRQRIDFSISGGKSFSISIIALYGFVDKVSIARRQLGSGIDETLLIENLLIDWCEIGRAAV